MKNIPKRVIIALLPAIAAARYEYGREWRIRLMRIIEDYEDR